MYSKEYRSLGSGGQQGWRRPSVRRQAEHHQSGPRETPVQRRIEARHAKRLPHVIFRARHVVAGAEGIQARVARLQSIVQRAVEVHAQVEAGTEAGAGQRRAVQSTAVVLLQQPEYGVSVRGISAGGEQNGAGARPALALGRPRRRSVPAHARDSAHTCRQ